MDPTHSCGSLTGALVNRRLDSPSRDDGSPRSAAKSKPNSTRSQTSYRQRRVKLDGFKLPPSFTLTGFAARCVYSQLAPAYADAPPQLAIPATGLSSAEVSAALQAHATLPCTRWEEGRVSGAVYNGTPEMGQVWQEAFNLFTVSNPLHADGQSPLASPHLRVSLN